MRDVPTPPLLERYRKVSAFLEGGGGESQLWLLRWLFSLALRRPLTMPSPRNSGRHGGEREHASIG